MKFAGKRPNLDKSSVIYNHNITIRDIPLEHIEVAHKLVERKIERLADAYENEVMDLEMYTQRSDRHKARISALEEEAIALREQQVTEQEIARSTASFEDFLEQIDTELATLTFDER